MTTATKEGRSEIFGALLAKNEELLDNLYSRWQDEKEHEDWADYDKALRAIVGVPAGWAVSKTTKRPFAVHLVGPEGEAHLYATADSVGWGFRKHGAAVRN